MTATSPFPDLRPRDIHGRYQWTSDKERRRAEKDARKVLADLDARRRAAQATEAADPARPTRPFRARSADILSDDQLRKLAVNDGLSAAQIARDTGISSRTIRDRAAKLGIRFPRREYLLKNPDMNVDDVTKLREQGVSWRQIAVHYGVSYAAVRRFRARTKLDTPRGQAA